MDIVTSPQMDKLIRMLATVEGRDKVFKTVQFACTTASQYIDPKDVHVERLQNLSSALVLHRKLFRFGNHFATLQTIVKLIQAAPTAADKLGVALQLVQHSGFLVYWIMDHLSYLAAIKAVPLDAQSYGVRSFEAFYWSMLAAVINNARALFNGKTTNSVIITQVRLTLDLLTAMFLTKRHPNFMTRTHFGWAGLIAGMLSVYQAWLLA